MTRRHYIQKWLTYILALLPIWMIDCYVLGRYPVYGTTPILLPLVVAAVATLEGASDGAAFAMGVGFLWETTYTGGTGFWVVYLTLLGYLCGAGVEHILQKGFFGYFICAIATLTAVEAILVLAWLVSAHGSGIELITLAGKQIVLTLIYAPFVYLPFWRVFRKVGGTKLA